MEIHQLNIISFNVPYPANYGGVIDVFYKIKHLHKNGIKVHLHCFDYGRGKQAELEKYCETVHYYKRQTGIFSFLSLTPYIVKSRVAAELKTNLLKNDFPILFEGLHTSFLLNDKAFKKRFKIIRATNIEHDYYAYLAKAEQHFFKKIYFFIEAWKAKKYEPVIQLADLILVVSKTDELYFKEEYPNVKTVFIPCFHSGEEITIQQGKGNYVLYHGNLGVPENEAAALVICNKIFNTLDIPLIVAGLHPTKKLKSTINHYNNIQLVENPTESKMQELISNAQINLLYTHQPTGLKLKLLHSLFKGRFCLANSTMLSGTTLNDLCEIADNNETFKSKIKSLFQQEMDIETIKIQRKESLADYSNQENCLKLIDIINTTTD
ncbi:MAG: mannosyltransferase [Flavobacteriales bacterium]|nr:mannosyltransferase [Flavobacteriales bacterium]